jgi:hypothetical protein
VLAGVDINTSVVNPDNAVVPPPVTVIVLVESSIVAPDIL